MAMHSPRFRPAWLDEGEDPDYRFTLANERTFLAWVRTSLALLAAAVVLHQLHPSGLATPVTTMSPALAVLSAIAAILVFFRWRAYEIAMRHERPLPAGLGLLTLAMLMVLAAGAFVLALVVSA